MERKSTIDAGSEFLRYFAGQAGYPAGEPLVIIAAAHFDDETIGLGGQIHRMKNTSFVHITDSSPRNLRDAVMNGCATSEEFSMVRYHEFCNAMSIAGHNMPASVEFGIPDQQASYCLKELACSMFELILNLRPDVIFTHPYEGGHPDHDACAFAVHSAADMLRRLDIEAPFILEFASYFSQHGKMAVCDFLPHQASEIYEVHLSEYPLDLKRKMMACYKSQEHVLRYFPTEKECYRKAPLYDFTKPPHLGKLYYENYDWGIDSKGWTGQAIKAQKELQVFL